MNNKWKHLSLKSPFIPLYQRGNYSIFMFPCEPKAHVDSRGSGNPGIDTGFRVEPGMTEADYRDVLLLKGFPIKKLYFA
jgi:hypothetical protein